MTTDTRKIQLGVGVDATGAKAGFQEVKEAAKDMSAAVSQEGQNASKGMDAVGVGATKAADSMNREEGRMRAVMQRTLLDLRTLGKAASEKFEIKMEMQGLDRSKFKSILDEIRAAEAQAKTAFSGSAAASVDKTTQALKASGVQFDQYGNSVKQTQAALRGLPAQFTDIAVSLQGGQNPLTVLLQQGGQLKDMFGGVGPAVRAMGGYVMGLIGPFTLAAGAVATLGLAYYKGSKETDEFRKSLIQTNNVAGTTAGQMAGMAKSIAEVVGTQGAAAAALTAIVTAGGVSAANLEKFATTAVRMQRTMGTSVEDTAKAFASLADEPLKASEKLNQGVNYLTLDLYKQIAALEEQGKKTQAAALAQQAYDSAMTATTQKLEANLGVIERTVQGVTGAWKSMWDAALGVGRTATLEDGIAKAAANVERLRAQSGNNVVGGGGAAGAQARRRATEDLAEEEARLRSLRQGAASQNRFAAENAGRALREKEAIAAQARVNEQEKATLSNPQRRAKEIAQLKRDAELLNMSLEKQNALEKQINEKYKDPARKKPEPVKDDAATKMLQNLREQESALREQLSTDEKLTASEKERAKFVQLVGDLKEKKVLTVEQKSLLAAQDTIKAQLDQNVASEKQLVLKREAQKLDEERTKDAKEFVRQIEAINISMASSAESRKDQQERVLDAFGKGDDAMQRVEAQRSIRNEYERYQRQLTKSAADKGQLGSPEYAAEVELIKQALNDALNAQGDYFEKLKEKQGDWVNGATAALANYVDYSKNMAQQVGQAFANAFGGMEDALVNFVKTGKLDFKSLADSIISDLARIAVRQAITGPLAKALMGAFSGGAVNMGTASGADMSLFYASANGNVFDNAPALSAYSGSIVSKPTIFPFARGAGLMGEAGPEAILPLKRGSDGKLGVAAGSGSGSAVTVNVINQSGGGLTVTNQTQRQNSDGSMSIDVMVDALDAAMGDRISNGSGSMARAMEGRYGLRTAVS